jgi:hypothetical protein
MDVVPVVRQKVAQSLGEGRVKREAMIDKVRFQFVTPISALLDAG